MADDGYLKEKTLHMIAFLEQEALEKADELDAKAEEEFNKEKNRLFKMESAKIIENYQKKKKSIELERKVRSSNLLNLARIRVLKAREDLVKQVLDEARNQLAEITKNTEQYRHLLEMMILQVLYQAMEAKVTLRCREVDYPLIKKVLPNAIKQYKLCTGLDLEVHVDTSDYLPAEIRGGIELLASNGRIKIPNTLESRLELVSHQLMPDIRNVLFGRNINRKFNT